jgi:hypothetical protein
MRKTLIEKLNKSLEVMYGADQNYNLNRAYFGIPRSGYDKLLYALGGFALIPIKNTGRFLAEYVPGIIEITASHTGELIRDHWPTPTTQPAIVSRLVAQCTLAVADGVMSIVSYSAKSVRILARTVMAPIQSFDTAWNMDRAWSTILIPASMLSTIIGTGTITAALAAAISPTVTTVGTGLLVGVTSSALLPSLYKAGDKLWSWCCGEEVRAMIPVSSPSPAEHLLEAVTTKPHPIQRAQSAPPTFPTIIKSPLDANTEEAQAALRQHIPPSVLSTIIPFNNNNNQVPHPANTLHPRL